MDTDCDDLDEIDFDINIDDTDIFGELDRPEGPSLVVDDLTVFNFSGEIELIELPEIESSIEIEVEKKEVLCSRKVIKCSNAKEILLLNVSLNFMSKVVLILRQICVMNFYNNQKERF